MTLLTPAYHFGLVVPDVVAAQDELTRALGLRWAAVQDRTVRIQTPAGTEAVDVTYVYSLDGPPYLELIGQVPGSVFGELGLHHMGVWCDDRHGESDRLAAMGCPLESVNVDDDGNWVSALFHRLECGLRVEVVDMAASGPKLLRYLAGGDYQSPPPTP